MVKKQRLQATEQNISQEDRGAGGVMLMLDHSSGQIFANIIGNITTEQVRNLLVAYTNAVEQQLSREAVEKQQRIEEALRARGLDLGELLKGVKAAKE